VKKTTVLVAAVLAAILTVGLTVLLTSMQEAHANPCANEISRGGSADNAFIPQDDDERECDFTGYFDFEEEIDSEDIPPTPPTEAFTITGLGGIIFTCGLREPFAGTLVINVERQEDGSVTGTAVATVPGTSVVIMTVTDATTDGNTFSLSGVGGQCLNGAFTLNGDCGTDVMASYEEVEGTGTFTGDVECTLL
jgi:hypothetical protein